MSDQMSIIVRAFRAIDEPDSCQEYIIGHRKVLEDYGVANVTSGTPAWLDYSNVFMIVAQTPDRSKMHGAIRIQIADESLPLPIETAIGHMDNRIYDIVKDFRENGGCGELCGLWNSKETAGRGFSVILTRAAISIINQIHFRTLVGICAEYTLKMFTNVGFVIDRSLGVNGEFAYPNPSYVTRVLGILNAETLDTAHPVDKEVMLALRENIKQTRIETGPKESITEVVYDLKIQHPFPNPKT